MLHPTLAISGGAIGAIIAGVVVLLIIFWVVATYNRLVSLRERFRNAFAQIEVQLKRRYDLIPNLVETVKGYMKHERETLEAVITARNQAAGAIKAAGANPGDPTAMGNLAGAENMLTGALGKLFALSEAYPDLKANQNMMQLTEELTTTENKVAFSRQAYNDGATTYNIAIKSFPPNVIAGMFGFTEAALLEFEDSEQIKHAPKVSF